MRGPFDTWPAAVAYLSSPGLTFEFASDQFRELLGGRDVAGLPVREAMPELAGQGRFELLSQAMGSGHPRRHHEVELRIRRQGEQPERVLVDFVYQPVRDAWGTVAGVLLLAHDGMGDWLGDEGLATQPTATRQRNCTLFDNLPEGVIYYAANGLIIEANTAARETLGIGAGATITWPLQRGGGTAVHEDGSPYPPEELPVMAALRTGEVADDVVGVPHGRTGELRWLQVTAVPDALDEDGRPQRAYAMFRDLTEQRRVEATLREETELMSRLRDANVLGVAVADEDRFFDANDAFLDIIGFSRDDLEAGRLSDRSVTAPECADGDAGALEQLRRTGAVRPYEKEYIHRDSHRVPVLAGAAVVGRNPLRWVTFAVDLSARQRAEKERAELLSRERAALAEAASAEERLTFMLRGGDLVAATRDRHELLQHASRLVVDSLADFCLAYMPDRQGVLRATSVAHRDATGAVRVTDLRNHPSAAVGQRTVKAAYVTGTSQWVHHAAARLAGLGPPVRDILTGLRPDDVLITPLLSGQQPIGVLAAGRRAGRPCFASTDITALEQLARQIGVGLASAETSHRDHIIAETLQRSVLPDALPEIPGLDLAMRYIPATDGADVGGDWYDAFPLDGSHVGLVIGDVVGHSITSASITGQVRNLLRAYALDKPGPADVLHCTNSAIARLLPEAVATAFFAVLDLTTGDLSYASAGHPPPACVIGAGQAGYLAAASGAMLGAPGGAFTAGHQHIVPGTALLLYTDGLIEHRHRDITQGLDELAGAMRQSAGLTAEQICTTVQAALLGATPRADDVCLLAARLTG